MQKLRGKLPYIIPLLFLLVACVWFRGLFFLLFPVLPIVILVAYIQLMRYAVSKPHRYTRIVLVSVLILIPIFLLIYVLSHDGFQDLPSGAINGEWAARAVEENNSYIFDGVDDLINSPHNRRRVDAVVRAIVLEVRAETVEITPALTPHTYSTHHLYTIYQIEVLDVYGKGVLDIDDVVDVIHIKQHESMERWFRWAFNTNPYHRRSNRRNPSDFSLVHSTQVSLSAGDDLILFLHREQQEDINAFPWERIDDEWVRIEDFERPILTHYLFSSPIQGIYRYTPQELRGDCENFAFESVNPHNNLTLTVADLLRFREQ
jgi:hypothetical protein